MPEGYRAIGPRALERYMGDRVIINFYRNHGPGFFTKGALEQNVDGEFCVKVGSEFIPIRHGQPIRIHPHGKWVDGRYDFRYIDDSD